MEASYMVQLVFSAYQKCYIRDGVKSGEAAYMAMCNVKIAFELFPDRFKVAVDEFEKNLNGVLYGKV